MTRTKPGWMLLSLASIVLAAGCGRRPYEVPIATDSQQPDKELFDRAVRDLETSRFTIARLTLQTLINAYPDSEYLAKAKLAIADSWYREGGSSSLLQAEAEYRDFITFFPTLPEASEAQMRVAMIHYHEMEKPDRDATHARRAEQEFQKMLLNYPDSPFAPLAEQRLREVQEVLAQGNFEVARVYFIQGNDKAVQARLKEVAERYPNFSQADEALYLLGKSLERSGEKTADEAIPYYSRIIRNYPLGSRVKDAKERLVALGATVPEPDPAAVARMTYENALAQQPGFFDKLLGGFSRRPNVLAAQGKLGPPTMTTQGPAQAAGFSATLPSQPDSATGSSPSQAIFLEPVPEPNATNVPASPPSSNRPSP
ncbi:MAG: outer membrane protein assembly factor BamD [Acidobacteria bacterium]|nr:outer membrane protein assembly factor BamD [Acidobacteriota bacterium]